jgi:hypothetical protein
VLAQRALGLDVRNFVPFGLLLGAPSGARGQGWGGAAGAGLLAGAAAGVEIGRARR